MQGCRKELRARTLGTRAFEFRMSGVAQNLSGVGVVVLQNFGFCHRRSPDGLGAMSQTFLARRPCGGSVRATLRLVSHCCGGAQRFPVKLRDLAHHLAAHECQ